MRRFTIIPDDNIVIVDGDARHIDCSGMDPAIHAVQWDNERKKGWIEWRIDHMDEELSAPNQGRQANKHITDCSQFYPQLDAWAATMSEAWANRLVVIDSEMQGLLEHRAERSVGGLPVDQIDVKIKTLETERAEIVNKHGKTKAPR